MSERDVEALAKVLCIAQSNAEGDIPSLPPCKGHRRQAKTMLTAGYVSPETLDERVREAVEAALAPIEALADELRAYDYMTDAVPDDVPAVLDDYESGVNHAGARLRAAIDQGRTGSAS